MHCLHIPHPDSDKKDDFGLEEKSGYLSIRVHLSLFPVKIEATEFLYGESVILLPNCVGFSSPFPDKSAPMVLHFLQLYTLCERNTSKQNLL